jgi:PhnB protein
MRLRGVEEMQPVKLNTYVNFAGTCAEAFRYYEKHLAARINTMMTHGDAPGPGQANPGWKEKVLHGRGHPRR